MKGLLRKEPLNSSHNSLFSLIGVVVVGEEGGVDVVMCIWCGMCDMVMMVVGVWML